ncbi:MAG: hypothetical protein ACFE0O_09030 [Opitutales bacterium]
MHARHRFPFTACLTACLLAGCALDRGDLAEEPARERLREAFVEATNQADAGALMALFHLEGVEKRDRQLLRAGLEREVGLPIESIRFEAVPPGDTIDYVFQGRRYGPTLEPTFRMKVVYGTEDGFTSSFLVGMEDGEARLITAAPVSDPDNGRAGSPDGEG